MTEFTKPIPQEPIEPRENIVLIGFMGTGKSTVGRRVASVLGWEFMDTDSIVVRQSGQEIASIFANEGEASFRRYETMAIHSLGLATYRVVSTGGGVVRTPENHELLQKLGCVVRLNASEEVILDRVCRNQHRPLLSVGDPSAEIHRLLQEREMLYQDLADVEIDTTSKTHEEVTECVVEEAFAFLSGGWKELRAKAT